MSIKKLSLTKIYLIYAFVCVVSCLFFYKYLLNDTYKAKLLNLLQGLLTGHLSMTYIIAIIAGLIGLTLVILIFKRNLNLVNRILTDPVKVKWILGIYLIVFFALFVWVAYRKYLNMATGLYDFGLEQQVIWNTSQGRWFQSGVEVKNYLGDHFSLITLLPAAIYYFVPGALTIFVIQALAFIISVVGVFYCAKFILKNNGYALMWSVFFSLAYGLAGILLYDYHPISLVLPFLTWGLYFHLKNNYKLTALLFFFASLCKEDVGLFIAAFGIYLLIKGKKKGIVFLIYGLTESLLALFVFIPYFRGGMPSDTLLRYAYLGNTPLQMLRTVFTNPAVMYKQLANSEHLKYLLKLFLPTGFLSIFAPWEAIMILPSLAVNLLSQDNYQISAMVQYDAINVVTITFSAMIGFAKIIESDKREVVKRLLIIYLIAVNFAFLIGHQIFSQYAAIKPYYNDHLFITDFKKNIPDDAVVSVTYFVGGQYGETKNLQLFYPVYNDYDVQPDVVIIDKATDFPDEGLQAKIGTLVNGNYHIYLENSSFLIILRNNYQLK